MSESSSDDVRRTMKPLFGRMIQEAVHLALIDSVLPEPDPEGETFEAKNGLWTEEQRAEMEADIFAIPDEALSKMDPLALAQNVSCRLLGTGGWEIPVEDGIGYAPNMSAQEIVSATFKQPDRNEVKEFASELQKAIGEEGKVVVP